MSKFVGFVMCAVLTVGLIGCGSVVPPGTTVVILTADGETSIHEKGMYKPWGRDKAYFVDQKLKSFDVQMEILCSDDINMIVSMKWIGCFNVTQDTIGTMITKISSERVDTGDVTGFQLSLHGFWDNVLKSILSSISRDVISQYNTDNIREAREEIRVAIMNRFIEELKQYPVDTSKLLLENLDYPPEVTAKRKKIKEAELQDLENAAIAKAKVASARRNAEIALEEGKAQLVKAEADAAANRVRDESLTPAILLVKQIEMQMAIANGPNNTSMMIPYAALDQGLMAPLLMSQQ